MDARIGELNGGKFYAYVNGYSAEPVIGTLAEVEAALNGGTLTTAQAKATAERAGLKCYFRALGKVWVIANELTGETCPYDAKSLKENGKNWFVAQVDRVLSGASLRKFVVTDETGRNFGTFRAINADVACDQVAKQYGYQTAADMAAGEYHIAVVVGLGGSESCKLTASEI